MPTNDSPNAPAVTADFLRAFKSARFHLDHVVQVPSGEHFWVALGPARHWLLAHEGQPVQYASLSLQTFRLLHAAEAQPDGSFLLTEDVELGGGIVARKGERGCLGAVQHPDGLQARAMVPSLLAAVPPHETPTVARPPEPAVVPVEEEPEVPEVPVVASEPEPEPA